MGLKELLENCKERIRKTKLRYELNVIEIVKKRALRLTDIMIRKEMYPYAEIKTHAFDSIYVNTKEFRIGFIEDKAYDGKKLEYYLEDCLKKGSLKEVLENVDFLWIRRPYHHNFHKWNLEPESRDRLESVLDEAIDYYANERNKLLEMERLLQLREELAGEYSMGSRSLNILKYNQHFDIALIAYKDYNFIVTRNDESGMPKGRDFVDRGGENLFVGDYMNVGVVRHNAVLGTKEEFEKIIDKCHELERNDKKFEKICFPEGRSKKTFSLELMGCLYQKNVAVRYVSIIDKENLMTALGLYKNIDF